MPRIDQGLGVAARLFLTVVVIRADNEIEFVGRDEGENLGILLRVGSETRLVGLQRGPILLHQLREERRMVVYIVR